jgi:hypothetical protein
MAQHDYVIANDTAANVRADINDALAAIVSNNSGSAAPATTYANQWWYDTTADILKFRAEANDAWISVAFLNQTTDQAFPIVGGVTVTSTGTELNVLDGIAGIATQAEAEAGTSSTKLMTPQRVAQAIAVTGKPFLGNAQFLTTDKTLTSTDDKDLLVCSANITVTLPAVSEGLVFGFVNASDDLVIIDTADPATLVGRVAGGVLLLARQEAIVVCDGVGWQMIGANDVIQLQTVQFPSSGTYVPHPEAKLFLACVTGATGGTRSTANAAKGASGGAGYSEKLYTAPFSASYSVTVGAGGTPGATGGTTTFGTISIPSSIGATSTGGTSGAAGTGVTLTLLVELVALATPLLVEAAAAVLRQGPEMAAMAVLEPPGLMALAVELGGITLLALHPARLQQQSAGQHTA